jgi:hypothetical protein
LDPSGELVALLLSVSAESDRRTTSCRLRSPKLSVGDVDRALAELDLAAAATW